MSRGKLRSLLLPFVDRSGEFFAAGGNNDHSEKLSGKLGHGDRRLLGLAANDGLI